MSKRNKGEHFPTNKQLTEQWTREQWTNEQRNVNEINKHNNEKQSKEHLNRTHYISEINQLKSSNNIFMT